MADDDYAHPVRPPEHKASEGVLVDKSTEVKVDPAVPYYVVTTENQKDFGYAIDPDTKKSVKDWGRITLQQGDKDATMPFRWITDLQEDLAAFGFKRVLRNKEGKLGEPDGFYGKVTKRTVQYFQTAAKKLGSYTGGATGKVDDDTKKEIKRWKDQNVKRKLRPFDPKNLLDIAQVAPAFKRKMDALEALLDVNDLELYGPTNKQDVFRDKATQDAIKARGNSNASWGGSWHNYGLASDNYLYSPTSDGPEMQDWFLEERMCYRNLLYQVGCRWGGEIPGFPAGDFGHSDFPNGISTKTARTTYNGAGDDATEQQRLEAIWGTW